MAEYESVEVVRRLERRIEEDQARVEDAVARRDRAGVCVWANALTEALLLHVLCSRLDIEGVAHAMRLAGTGGRPYRGRPKFHKVMKYVTRYVIDAARRVGILSDPVAEILQESNHHRHLVHPSTAIVRLDLTVFTAELAQQAIEALALCRLEIERTATLPLSPLPHQKPKPRNRQNPKLAKTPVPQPERSTASPTARVKKSWQYQWRHVHKAIGLPASVMAV